MSELHSLVSDIEVGRLRMQRVRAHQKQQQRVPHNEIELFRRRSAPLILERAAFRYDQSIDYCADKSFCQLTQSKAEIIQKVFPDVAQYYLFHDWYSERAILATKNTDVNGLNLKIEDDIPGEMRTTNKDDVVNYPPEYLN
ncbi:unnamed protein product [Pieris brassicae]|uniref:ATP-dependent DNA helicase n=1 Tax=Pieris brassicae TaxID=7116 RepID=A0A9P0TP90_PIEBR|nr:unnamed protein product [Pieris brassicae]